MSNIVAWIDRPNLPTLEVQLLGYNSYNVPGIRAHLKSGKIRACYGCRDDIEALRVVKQLGKLNGQSTTGWKLRRQA